MVSKPFAIDPNVCPIRLYGSPVSKLIPVNTTLTAFAINEYRLPGVAVNDNCVYAIHHTIINVTLSAGLSVKAVQVNLPSPAASS